MALIQGVPPISHSYVIEIVSPYNLMALLPTGGTMGLTVDFIRNAQGVPAIPATANQADALKYVTFSDPNDNQPIPTRITSLNFTGSLQTRSVRVHLNVPADAVPGSYGYRIKATGWPIDLNPLVDLINNGSDINATVSAPPGVQTAPVVAIGTPGNGQIITVPTGTSFPITVPFTFTATATGATPGPISAASANFGTATMNLTSLTGLNTVSVAGGATLSIPAEGQYLVSASATNSGGTATDTHVFYVRTGTAPAKPVLTVTANNVTRAYGQNHVLTAQITGPFLEDDNAGNVGTPFLSTAATQYSPVGQYPIAVSVGSLDTAKYDFIFVDGTLTIDKASVTSNTVVTKVYDGNTSAPPPSNANTSLAGVLSRDVNSVALSFTSATAFYASAAVGSHALTISGVSLSGTAASNYSLTASGTGTITASGGGDCNGVTFSFNGSSAGSGTADNIRTYTVNGVSVKASAFSRARSGGAFSPAFLGVFPGGLGVTDSSEGNGEGNLHTTDNLGGRDNYILFEFSQPVKVDRAFLGYVVNDSDATIWVGDVPNAYNNHQTLSNDLLAGFAREDSDTTSANTRWADINAANRSGNVLVIAASVSDTTPDDEFKVGILEVCAGTVTPPPPAVNLAGFTKTGTVGTPFSASVVASGGTPPYRTYSLAGTLPAGLSLNSSTGAVTGTPTVATVSAGVTVTVKVEDSAGQTATALCTITINAAPPPPNPGACLMMEFDGSSAASGPAGNSRAYTMNGVSVKVSAFSRAKPSPGGNLVPAYVGVFPGGLGVTDSGEGNGAGNLHTVDNLGRDNFLLFEFSQPVVLNKAFLGYVINDSDLTVWIGNGTNVSAVSDAMLGQMIREDNDTTSANPRWADVNASQRSGNVIVIAASVSDTSPDDEFKVGALEFCTVGAPPAAPAALPSPWQTKDIGGVGAVGSATHANGTFTVKGSGREFGYNCSDEFRFVYQQASGDCVIIAKVLSVSNTNDDAGAGVMIRDSLTDDSRHAALLVTAEKGIRFRTRASTGGSTDTDGVTGYGAPYWVKLVRSGNTFSAYRSSNGSSWTLIDSDSISMGASVYIGLVVNSRNDGVLCTGTFSSVSTAP